MPVVKLPSQLAGLAEGKTSIAVNAATIKEAFVALDQVAPMVRSQLFHKDGAMRPFVGIFVDGNQVIDPLAEDHLLQTASTLLVVMSVAGG